MFIEISYKESQKADYKYQYKIHDTNLTFIFDSNQIYNIAICEGYDKVFKCPSKIAHGIALYNLFRSPHYYTLKQISGSYKNTSYEQDIFCPNIINNWDSIKFERNKYIKDYLELYNV